MDSFDRVNENYQKVCNALTRRIKQLPNYTGESKKRAIRDAEQDINDGLQYINEMDRISQSHPQRIKIQQQIRQYQTDMQRFQRDVLKASTTSSNDFNRDAGFSNAPEDYQSQYDQQRQHLLGGYEVVNESSDRLVRIQQTSAQNEQIGEGILVQLGEQGNQIRSMKNKLDETDDNVKTARKVIGSMARRVATNKIILLFIIFLLLAIITLIICLKWLRTKK
ncbi:hypothetical protein SAMD00019534_118300 [Acytostelium subglobosum LB1]|uniref:hypothetical protein n=1 Tax=Acytostelium subglobosum LB1 TaxID=1410327 RepID=UPI000644FF29|nr:hypothetical protein SAMD00019534_118300 [Acytostelium subglobosum LB1]GAM28654.1 hypothetical protein SAMD00019534_118300 [Acytostelium subglobosum LB1]|eukprot:XP_012748432.1 hypothetical protein SAMD00019534_118300 [Acytostelium subglobosum LB1]